MITTDRFVYIHLHKSGGTFVNECLLRFFPGARQVGYHLPRRMVPKPFEHLPVLGFVRNPWSYYVSWFSFQSQRPTQNALFEICSERGTLGFKATVRNLLNLGSGSAKLDELLPLLTEHYMDRGLNLPRFALEAIRNSGLGFYSYLYRYMYLGMGGPLHVGRAENLREDLLAMLAEVGASPSEEARRFIVEQSSRNASRHEPYWTYYDDELRQLVAGRDADLIKLYRYECQPETAAGTA
jgi:hypothetical protein